METSVWLDVIHAYLTEYAAANRRRSIELNEISWELRFLAAHAVDALRQDHIAARDASRKRDAGDAGPKESITVVEQSERRIVVEVPAHRSSATVLSPIPFWPTRFVLTKVEPGWLIESMFQPCMSCNLPASAPDSPKIPRAPGRCFLCRGQKEIGNEFKQRGFWTITWWQAVKRPCFACNGSGACSECAGESMPGWTRIVSLGGQRPVRSGSHQPTS